MTAEKIILDAERGVTLMAYVQGVHDEFGFDKRPAMLVLPGGGYSMCSDREGDPVANAYLTAGYQAFVLRYTVKSKGAWPLPLEDYEAAMALIEQNAEQWHVDTGRIAAIGFSAGGHLCACAATIAKHKPAAAVLVYPAILKEICDTCQPGMPYPNEHVNADTCPCFLVSARDDHAVDVENNLQMQLALAKNGIPFESHIYAYGGHGFSTATEWLRTSTAPERLQDWVGHSVAWLEDIMGGLTNTGFTEPKLAVSKNGDNVPVLSVACTLKHIRRQNEQAQALLRPLYERMEAIAKQRGYHMEGLVAAMGSHTVRELMEFVQMDADTIKEIDTKLHDIVNQLYAGD